MATAKPSTKRTPNLKRLREARGLTREELAAEIASTRPSREGRAITTRTLKRWEDGDTPIPKQHWSELSALFSVSVAFLLGLDDGVDGGNGHALETAA